MILINLIISTGHSYTIWLILSLKKETNIINAAVWDRGLFHNMTHNDQMLTCIAYAM